MARARDTAAAAAKDAEILRRDIDTLRREATDAAAARHELELALERQGSRLDEERRRAAEQAELRAAQTTQDAARLDAAKEEALAMERRLTERLHAAEAVGRQAGEARDTAQAALEKERDDARSDRQASALREATLQQQLAQAHDDIREARAEAAERDNMQKSERERSGTLHQQLQDRLAASAKKLLEAEARGDRAESGAASLRARITEAEEEMARLRSLAERAREALDAERQQRQDEARAAHDRITDLTSAAVAADDTINHLRADVMRMRQEHEAAAEKAAARAAASDGGAARLRDQVQRLEGELASLNKQLDQLRLDGGEVGSALRSQCAGLTHELELSQRQVAELAAARQRLDEAKASVEGELRQCRGELGDASREAALLRDKLAEMEQAGERLNDAIRRLQADKARQDEETAQRRKRDAGAIDEAEATLTRERAVMEQLRRDLGAADDEIARLRRELGQAAGEAAAADALRREIALVLGQRKEMEDRLRDADADMARQEAVFREKHQQVAAEMARGLGAAQQKMAELVQQIERLRVENTALRERIAHAEIGLSGDFSIPHMPPIQRQRSPPLPLVGGDVYARHSPQRQRHDVVHIPASATSLGSVHRHSSLSPPDYSARSPA